MSAQQPLLPPLLADVRQLIDATHLRVAQAVNAELTQLHWQIGRRTPTSSPLYRQCERSAAIHVRAATAHHLAISRPICDASDWLAKKILMKHAPSPINTAIDSY